MNPFEAYSIISSSLSGVESGPDFDVPERRILWLCDSVCASIFGGGLASIFEGEWPHWVRYSEIISAFDVAGIHTFRDIMQQACELFPNIDTLSGESRRKCLWGLDGAEPVISRLSAFGRLLDVKNAICLLGEYALANQDKLAK